MNPPLPQILRERRESEGLTRNALAEKAGFHPNSLAAWEQEKVSVSLLNLIEWVNALGLEIVLKEKAS